MSNKFKIVHYLNQFFGQIGGEDKADIPPRLEEGAIGPGAALNNSLGEETEIVNTIICGDTFFNENLEESKNKIKEMLEDINPDLLIAGPAFNAGRYGVACGTVAEIAKTELGIDVVSGIYPENPGYEMFREYAYFVETPNSAAGMRSAIPDMMKIIKSYIEKNGDLGSPEEEGYMPRGVRKNIFVEERGAARAVKMLLKKLNDEDYETEYPMPVFDRVDPVDPIKDMSQTKVALVTSGGIVPKGNPDHIESSSASKYGEYSLEDVMDLEEATYETAHGGYDPICVNKDADRVLPVDVMRDLEEEGVIGELHNKFYTTVGNGTSVANAKAYAQEISEKLLADGVQAVILTSTWGTCTRCGATMVKEIERAGIPVVHVATVVPISITVGANRIVPAVAIPYPLGQPELDKKDEKQLRRNIVEKSLLALQTAIDEQTVFSDDDE